MEPAELSTHVEEILCRSQKRQRKEKHTVTTLWKLFVQRWTNVYLVPAQRKPFSIIQDKVIKPANEPLEASLKDLARQGLISFTKHKRPVSSKDLEALYAANQLGLNAPESLHGKYNMVLHYSLLRKESLWKPTREKTEWPSPQNNKWRGLKCFALNKRTMKNNPGEVISKEDESQSVMMAWPENPRCPVACPEKYLAKRDPRCDSLRQKRKNHNASSFSWCCSWGLGL